MDPEILELVKVIVHVDLKKKYNNLGSLLLYSNQGLDPDRIFSKISL